MKLLLSQKDELFDYVTGHNFSPADFEFKESVMGSAKGRINVTILNYKPNSDFRFEFFDPFDVRMAPDQFMVERFYEGVSWNEVLINFARWLSCIYREITQPDKWNRFQKEVESIGVTLEGEDGDNFSISEFEEVKRKLEQIQKSLSQIGLSKDQQNIFHKKLDFLVDAAKTQTKFNWKSLFIGTIVNVVVAANVSPDQASALWKIIKSVFAAYFLTY